MRPTCACRSRSPLRTTCCEWPATPTRRGGSSTPAAAITRLALELLCPTEEDEVVLTGAGRFVARLRPVADTASQAADNGVGFVLHVTSPGTTPELRWTPRPVPAIGPEDVLIEVRASAWNYRDIMVACGIIPPEQGTNSDVGLQVGVECSGVVAAVGEQVTGFRVGDRVCAVARASLASHVATSASTVAHIPDSVAFTEAATLPVVFFTVEYSLELARLAAGETVLVHGAAGGVGLAALQVARARGARVIATAGTPAKRDLLRLLGVEHVLDSRSLDFAPAVRRITGGRGVDVVLNSLAGEALVRSLELLAIGGRFVELGKRDIVGNSRLPMAALAGNVSVLAVDAHQLMDVPEIISAQLGRISARLMAGEYHPLPHRVYPASELSEAFAALQHSRHLGKVVISMEQPPMVANPGAGPRLNDEGSYLVTGGLSGLGGATAVHLAELGARHLVLVGRRGADHPEAQGLLVRLAGLGAEVAVHAADVTDANAVRAVLASIPEDHPLRGVVHAAMVLDDAPLAELDRTRLRAVFAPKALALALLVDLTSETELDFFLAHSAGSAVVGLHGQAAYGAGNMVTEALVRARRAKGLPGTAIGWGAINRYRVRVRNQLAGSLARLGMDPISTKEAMAALDRLLVAGEPGVALVGRIDLARMAEVLPGLDVPRFAEAIAACGGRGGTREAGLAERLHGLSAEEAMPVVAEVVAEAVAAVLQTTSERLDPTRRLDQLGLDSLMAAEVVVALRQRTGCEIPALEVVGANSITDLGRRVLARIQM